MSTNLDLKELSNALHQRLLAGSATATANIAEVFLPLLTSRLRQRYPNLDDPHLVDTAVEDALVSYFKRPKQYDPVKLSLASYLRMSADGDLRNSLKSQKNDTTTKSLDRFVELEDRETEYQLADNFDLEAQVMNNLSPVWRRLNELVTDPIDQEIVLLMMEGVRDTKAYAEVLGVSEHSFEKQAAAVKRHKDRLKKVLRRAIKPSELGNE